MRIIVKTTAGTVSSPNYYELPESVENLNDLVETALNKLVRKRRVNIKLSSHGTCWGVLLDRETLLSIEVI